MLPLSLQVDRLGLLDTYAGIILPSAITPFTIFLLRQAFLTLPDEYVDEPSWLPQPSSSCPYSSST